MTGGEQPGPAVAFDHLATEETDIDARVRFYRDVLGYRLLRWGTHVETGRRIALLADGAGTAKAELIEVERVTGELAHTGYRVPDVPAAHAAFLAAGCAELRAPFRLEAARADTSFVADPAGRRIQLIAYDPGSPDHPAPPPGGRP